MCQDQPLNMPVQEQKLPSSWQTLKIPKPPNPQAKRAGGRSGNVATLQFHKDMNRWLTRVAELGDLDELLNAVSSATSEMNGINLATAFHRIAKLSTEETWTNGDGRLWQHLAFEDLINNIQVHIDGHSLRGQQDLSIPPHLDEMPVQCLSIVAWSCTTLGILNKSLFESIALIATPRLDEFQPFELTNLVWALAKANMAPPELLNAAMLKVAQRRAGQFRAQCLSILLWSFATAGCCQPEVFADIAKELILNTERMRPTEISNTLWAFAKSGCSHPQLFEALGNSVIKDSKIWLFRPQELSNTLWAYATAGVQHDSFLALAEVLALQKRAELSPQNIANILWSYAKLQVSPKADLCGTLLDASIGKLSEFTPGEIISLTWSAAQLCPKYTRFFGAVTSDCVARIGEFSGKALGIMIKALSSTSTERPDLYAELLSVCRARLSELEPATLYNITQGLTQGVQNQCLAEVINCSADVPAIVHYALVRTQDQCTWHARVLQTIAHGRMKTDAVHDVVQSQEIKVPYEMEAQMYKQQQPSSANLETLSTSAESSQQEDEDDATQRDWDPAYILSVVGPPPGLSPEDVAPKPNCENLPRTRLASLSKTVKEDFSRQDSSFSLAARDMPASHMRNSGARSFEDSKMNLGQLQLPAIPVTCFTEAGPGGALYELDVFQARNGVIGTGAHLVHLRQGVLHTRVVVKCVPGRILVPAMVEPHQNILWPLAEIVTVDTSCSYVTFPHCHHGTLAEWATAKAAIGQPVSVAEASQLLLGVLQGAEALCAMSTSAIRAVQANEIFIGTDGQPRVRVPVLGSSLCQDDSLKWMSPEEVLNQVSSESGAWEAISYRLGLLMLSFTRGSYADPYPNQTREMVLIDLLQKVPGNHQARGGVALPGEAEFQGPLLVRCLLDACLRKTRSSAPPREVVVQALNLLTTLDEPLTIAPELARKPAPRPTELVANFSRAFPGTTRSLSIPF